MKWLYNKLFPIHFAAAATGFSAITLQVVFLRELISIFYGNELIYGMILGLWLITYSIGSGLLGRLADSVKNRKNLFVITQALILALFPALIFMTRTIKNILNIPQGALVGLPAVLLISFFILLPVTVIFGFQFSLLSKILAEESSRESEEIGWVYMLEAVGSVIGGLALSGILLYFLNSFQISALLAFVLAVSAYLLVKNFRAALLIALALLLLASASYLERVSSRISWQGYDLVRSADSPYGKLAVIKDRNDYSFFMNGSFLFSTADRAGAEEFVHLSLLKHPDPDKILLIGGGWGGTIGEILKYPVRYLDYVELDPKVIQLAREFIPLALPSRVNLHASDGIRFLSESGLKFDIIMVDLPEPQSALVNRFYTLEFFNLCKSKLGPKGMLAFKLPGSSSFMGSELRALNASIYKTVSASFKQVNVIPGNSNYFFASGEKMEFRSALLLQRWQKMGIQTEYFKPPALVYDLAPERIKDLAAAIRFTPQTRINTDLRPVSYYQSFMLWSSYFHSSAKNMLNLIARIELWAIILILSLFIVMIMLLTRKMNRFLLPLLIALLGFAGMGAQIIIILVFQVRFGYVYQMISLLTAAFMGGLAWGSYQINSHFEKITAPRKTMLFFLFPLLLYFASFIGMIAFHPLFPFLTQSLFPLSSLIIGSLVGAVFPLAVKFGQAHRKEIGHLAGVLYGADLLGSSLAAVLVSIFFVPLYGVLGTAVISVCAIVLSIAVVLVIK